MDGTILLWEEDQVHAFLSSLGFQSYEAQIKEHGITGEILVHLDHEALKDVGIHSVGHRLAILKAVYNLKLQHDVPIEEGHWVPPSEFIDQVMLDSPSGVIPPDRMYEMLRERDERIRALEQSIQQLADHMSGVRDEVHVISKTLYTKEPPVSINRLRSQHSPTSHIFPTNSNTAQGQLPAAKHVRSDSLHKRAIGTANGGSPSQSPVNSPTRRGYMPSSSDPTGIASAASTGVPLLDIQEASGSRSANPSGTSLLQHSSSLRRPRNMNALTTGVGGHGDALVSPLHLGGSAVSPLPTSISLTSQSLGPPGQSSTATSVAMSHSGGYGRGKAQEDDLQLAPTPTQSDMLVPPISASNILNDGLHATRPSASNSPRSGPSGRDRREGSSSRSDARERDGKERDKNGHSIENPYKNFRVTYDDPCYKVLPAAMRKYRINDDWRLYALFICYGSNERCLSYDEKPLLLFQKLKDTNQSPVLMLRHIKDIQQPIVAALAKHATRREKRIKEGKQVTGDGVEGPIREFSRATRLHHPVMLQSVSHAKSPSSPNVGPDGKDDSGEKSSLLEDQAYAIAIYPYLADREDEFDVTVGDTFVILNKTKGWWVVHRDTTATQDSDIVRSGWVPQGCLLEMNISPASFASSPVPSSVPIPPSSILSVSTPGIALMDYTPRGSDEITMKKEDRLRVFKRYNHWSYVIKESNGDRGWTPSWFVGKVSSSSQQSTPTSASVSAPLMPPPSIPQITGTPSAFSARDGETTPTTASMPLTASSIPLSG